MKKSPFLPRHRGSLLKMTGDSKLAAVLGVGAFATLWLHDALVMNVFIPATIDFIAGGVTFLAVFATVKLPPKVGALVAFGIILAMAFFAFPQS